MTKLSTGLVAAAVVLLLGSAAFGQGEKPWDALAKRVLSGETLPAETIAACHQQFLDYYETLRAKNKAQDLYGLSDEDNAAHYVNAIKLAVIDPKQHGGWPVRHVGISRAYAVIKTRLQTEGDASLMVAAIVPAIANDDAAFAIAVYKKLQAKDSAWAKYILTTVQRYFSETTAAETFLEAFVPATPGEAKKSDGIGPRYPSECNGKTYLVRMTATALRASPDLDVTNAALPKPMAEIIEIAFAKLETIAGSRKGWTHSGIHFYRPAGDLWKRQDPALAKRWYYMVEFATKVHDEGARYPRDATFRMPITVDGRLGGIWYEGPKKVVVVESP